MKFLYHFDFEMCFAQRPRAPNFQPCSDTEPFVPFWLRNMFSGHSCAHFEHLNLNSQNAPILVCFVRFDLEMCFAPQPRTPFRHLNFQVWFGAAVFLTFWLSNLLRATPARNFWSLIPLNGFAPTDLANNYTFRHYVLRRFYLFGAPCFFLYWLFLFSDFFLPFSSLIFFLLTLSLLWLCCFICPYCRKCDF